MTQNNQKLCDVTYVIDLVKPNINGRIKVKVTRFIILTIVSANKSENLRSNGM